MLEKRQGESSNLKSSWLDLIKAKTACAPNYTGEYTNAVYVVQELIDMYGEADAFTKLFLSNDIPPGPPTTRLAHAKRYVIDEFIKMQVMASVHLRSGLGSKVDWEDQFHHRPRA